MPPVGGGYALGIDVGASSVKLAAVAAGTDVPVGAGASVPTSAGGLGRACLPADGDACAEAGVPEQAAFAGRGSGGVAPLAPTLIWSAREPHRGDPMGSLVRLLARVSAELGSLSCVGLCATGDGARAIGEFGVGAPLLEDVPAITRGASLLAPTARSVIEIGGQNAIFVAMEPGRAPEFSMNESCASGTGSFFEDQMSRLGMRIEDYSRMVARATSVPRLSGRCSVFAKTDIIHRQQEGVPVEDILLGLCYAMVRSYKATIVRGLPVRPPVVLAGGVSLNSGVVRAVREVFGLDEDKLLTSEDMLFLQAAGAALEAAERAGLGAATASARPVPAAGGRTSAPALDASESPAPALDVLIAALAGGRRAHSLPSLAPLPRMPLERRTGFSAMADAELAALAAAVPDGRVPVTLGIDVGSTSTDLVLLDGAGRIVSALYLRTGGDATQAVREGLARLGQQMGARVRVRAVATTGSGRERMGKLVGADIVRDEITAQAAAAAKADSQVDAVFEIGGQDSKFISLEAGQVADFQMNKICAAGTGSFVEEQAVRMGIALDDFGPLALSSTAPIDLGERCTVFVESAINSALAEGAEKRDVAAGLCLSVVRNYLHRVVGSKRVGSRIALQGGVAYNPGIVAAFKSYYGGRLTVSPWFAVSGAAGVALLAAEAAERPAFAGTTFKGWDLSGSSRALAAADEHAVAASRAFYAKSRELFLAGYTPVREPGKKTVGIPRALLLHRLFPMANAFFRELGFNTYLTPESADDTIRAAQATCQGETCYPVKLVHGHMAQLAEAGVDYVFMPRVRTMRHEGSSVRHNYACVYMQAAPLIAAKALHFEERGIKLISPMLDMEFGQVEMASAMLGVGAELGFTPERTAQAMLAGGFALTEYGARVEALGDELLASLAPGERVLVIVTRNYGIADPVLNMGIPEILLEHGVKVITMGHLHGHDVDVSDAYPDMCWPFGQHILGSARIIREDPRLFAVYLTNHGCGPDTMLSHLFAEEMAGKPYLQVEVDEHFSKVGVITRVEAFLNALEHWDGAAGAENDAARAAGATVPAVGGAACGGAAGSIPHGASVPAILTPHGASAPTLRGAPTSLSLACELSHTVPVALPDLGPHARHVAEWLRGRGLDVRLAPADSRALDAGRAEATTKEYLTFTALLGQALVAAGDTPGTQVVVPRTAGAEADSQYARVISGVLAKRGLDAIVVAPRFETLPWELADIDGFFDAVLAGDVELARAGDVELARAGDAVLPRAGDIGLAHAGNAELASASDAVLARTDDAGLARIVMGSDSAPSGPGEVAPLSAVSAAHPAPKAIGLVGEWELVASDALTDGLFARAAAGGVRVRRAPLAEYLWFLWNDDLASERDELERRDAEGGFPILSSLELERRQAILDRLADRMRTASAELGDASPFSVDLPALVRAADEAMGRFAGGGGRYRCAKALELGREVDGVVAVSSMYENTETILQLLGGRDGAPMLSLAFDGSPGRGTEERLRSFLYYL